MLATLLSFGTRQMIGSVENLQTLAEAGMLSKVFKPVIAASIESALGGGGGGGAAAGGASVMSADAAAVPMREIKRLLMLNGAPTWGSEVELRTRASMFVQTAAQTKNAQWDAATQAWTAGVPVVDTNPPKAKVATFAVPAAQRLRRWAVGAARRAPRCAERHRAAEEGRRRPCATRAPHPLPRPPRHRPAPPAADPNKSTFTVTLKTPDGDKTFECPPDVYLLDQTDELDNADDFADLPYACRAGSCSACAGKVLSGTVDLCLLVLERRPEGGRLHARAQPSRQATSSSRRTSRMTCTKQRRFMLGVRFVVHLVSWLRNRPGFSD